MSDTTDADNLVNPQGAKRLIPRRVRRWGRGLIEQAGLALAMLKDPAARAMSGRLRELKGAYRGRRCFIMGNGPSLNKMDLDLFADEYVWGANRCFLLYDRIKWRHKLYAAMDTRVVPDAAGEIAAMIEQLPETKFFFPYMFRAKRILPGGPNVYWFNQICLREYDLPAGMFSADPAHWVYEACTVTIAAMQLAVHMGFNPIYLIGCDTSYSVAPTVKTEGGDPDKLVSTADDDANHFDPSYFGAGRKWHDPHVERMIFHYAQSQRVCRQLGAQVYNATVGGALEVFPRVDYAELFD